MACIFDVSPYDGGWCVKIADTGEVLFFTARRRAIAEARAMARVWPEETQVKVRGRRTQPAETWPKDLAAFPYPLGVPA
jgi:hypothetical protein